MSPSIASRDQQPRFHTCLGPKKPPGISRGMPFVSVHQQLFPAPGEWIRGHPVGTAVLILLLLVLVLALGVAVAVLAGKGGAAAWCVLGCPFDWVGYMGVCYYFSRDYSTWEQGQERCSELGASLAIAKDEEMDLLFRLCGNVEYWLGLRRRGERLHWGDGSSYSSRVPVLGNSQCVYLADRNRLRSDNCSNERPYLCSKAPAPL
ncbi:C-type lectin domain family 2 member B-like [Molothrus aeneus]|uniref:C-type lectin domain family 2 member B-like n=1 Tax=Molothrus aeneus TaxID=84833 RepID=UPI00345A059A